MFFFLILKQSFHRINCQYMFTHLNSDSTWLVEMTIAFYSELDCILFYCHFGPKIVSEMSSELYLL